MKPYPKMETEKRCSQGNAGNISIRHIRFDRDASDLKAFLSDGKGAVVLLEGAVADGDAFVMVARVDGSVAGWAVVRTAYRSDTGWQPEGGTVSFVEGVNAYLEYLEVSEPFRRRGVGTELLLACHREAARRHKKRIWLHTGEENTGAHSIYERSGWSHHDTVHPSWREGRPTRIYTRELPRYGGLALPGVRNLR